MIRHKNPIDSRPFQAKADLERQEALEAKYTRIAIDELVAALHHMKAAVAAPRPIRVADAA